MMVGIPGSGKSTLAESWVASGEVDWVVSSDDIRCIITGDAGDVSQDNRVWPLFYGYIEAYLQADARVVADATHLTPKSWKPLTELAEKYHIEPIAHIMRTPNSESYRRNRERERQVPDEVMRRMWWNYTEWARPKTLSQLGFHVVEHFPKEGGDSDGNQDQGADALGAEQEDSGT